MNSSIRDSQDYENWGKKVFKVRANEEIHVYFPNTIPVYPSWPKNLARDTHIERFWWKLPCCDTAEWQIFFRGRLFCVGCLPDRFRTKKSIEKLTPFVEDEARRVDNCLTIERRKVYIQQIVAANQGKMRTMPHPSRKAEHRSRTLLDYAQWWLNVEPDHGNQWYVSEGVLSAIRLLEQQLKLPPSTNSNNSLYHQSFHKVDLTHLVKA